MIETPMAKTNMFHDLELRRDKVKNVSDKLLAAAVALLILIPMLVQMSHARPSMGHMIAYALPGVLIFVMIGLHAVKKQWAEEQKELAKEIKAETKRLLWSSAVPKQSI